RSSPSTALKSVSGDCLVRPSVRMIAMEQSPSMDLGLRDSASIVTGASGGMGRAAALALAGGHGAVLLVGRRSETLADVAGECRTAGGLAEPLALDVTAVDA